MSVDLEAIAQRGRCDVSALQLARPLLEQGYTPPFLARYRRDELGGLDESTLWALSAALQMERDIASRREELRQAWEQTPLRDAAIGQAINKSNSLRMLARLTRRVKSEAHDAASDSMRLAVRILNPQKGDGTDFQEIAAKVDGIGDANAAVAGLDQALVKRLCEDPRIIASAVRWLVKHARIHVVSISDPHTAGDEPDGQPAKAQAAAEKGSPAQAPKQAANDAEQPPPETSESTAPVAAPSAASAEVEETAPEVTADTTAPAETTQPAETAPPSAPPSASQESAATPPTAAEAPAAGEATSQVVAQQQPTADAPADSTATPQADAAAGESAAAPPPASEPTSESKPAPKTEGGAKTSSKAAAKGKQKAKKISPRQRRRRWLVGVLKPLAGKRFNSDKLSSFQIVMLGRALRSQVAVCAFEYDATKLVAELQRTAGTINRHLDQQLRDLVLQHEAAIREAAESAWWDDLGQRASTRLVSVTADHLRRQMDRGGVKAKVVMSIDAIGPRTAATSIVSLDGRLLHSEDLPCQLSSALRSQAVAKMGELIHTYHVDLLIVSNGPARRATMTALGDLIAQSPENSIRWTLADRSGADAYASSQVADQEMRSTPRRFRAAAWLAFSILHPAQALAKVDPLKLRLSSFQRELSDEATLAALKDVMISGASRGGVDVNSAPQEWLERLPGVSSSVAQSIDAARRKSLFDSRTALAELEEWENSVHRRQALPFLRVFGGAEVLDGTLIHPEDYPLAHKLAAALEIELPPSSPPGYTPPDYSVPEKRKSVELAATEETPAKPEIEEFSSAGQNVTEFEVDAAAEPAQGDSAPAAEASSESAAQAQASDQPPEPEQAADQAATEPEQSDAEQSDAEQSDAQGSKPVAEDSAQQESDTSAGDQGESPDEEPSATVAEDQQTEAAESPSGQQQAAEATQDEAAATKAIINEIPEPIIRPKPEKAKIDKCVKEWQIGARRAHQLVHWLCDPFGDSDSSGVPPAVLSNMPSAKSLKPGDQVIGVVVGVMPFGVFVELAPDCSGLIHVSRVADSYIDDLHEAVQVGDVMTAWVTGIDEKRRRVALSAVSPQREAEIEQAKRKRDDHGRGPRPRGGGDRGRGRGQSRSGEGRGKAPAAGPAQAAKSGGPTGRGGKDQGRGNEQRRGGRGRDAGKGGRSRDTRGGGRGREKKPESYRVVSKQEAKPITDAMQKGEEPLRSFGDLMQFFDKVKSPAPGDPPSVETPSAQSPPSEAPQGVTTQADTSPAAESDAGQAGKPTSPATPSVPAESTAAAAPQPTSDKSADHAAGAEDAKPSADASGQSPADDGEVGSDSPENQSSSRADAST